MANSRKHLSAPKPAVWSSAPSLFLGEEDARLRPVLSTLYAGLVDVIFPLAAAEPYALLLGLSGGLDSVVLLDAFARLAAHHEKTSGRPPFWTLSACHIHHGLSPNADAWLAHCRAACTRLSIPFFCEFVDVDRASGQGIEAAARLARYAALSAVAERVSAKVLASAHHADDQVETVLLQLFRGTGLRGLAAMPRLRPMMSQTTTVQLWRPLRDIGRSDLVQYAEARALTWLDDESNIDRRYARNALRHDVLPAIDAAFPHARQQIVRAARHAAQAQALCDVLADSDLKLLEIGKAKRPSAAPAHASVIDRQALARLSNIRQRNVIRYWMRQVPLPAASEARLSDLIDQLLRHSAQGVDMPRVDITHGGAILIGYRNTAYWVRGIPRDMPTDVSDASTSVSYDGAPIWALPGWRACVHIRAETATGAEGDTVSGPMQVRVPSALLASATLAVRAREGGERLRLGAARPSRSLKQLFQSAGIAPRQRAQPVFVLDGYPFFVPLLGGDISNVPGEHVGPWSALTWMPDCAD